MEEDIVSEGLKTNKIGAGNSKVPLGFGNLYATIGDHIGHFYETSEEWKKTVVSFLVAGLAAGDKCVYFLDPGQEDQLAAALADASDLVKDALASGQLTLAEGKGSPREMKEALATCLAEIPGRYPLLRWGGDMTWSLKKLPTTEALMEWETHCNVIENPPAVFLCQYDLKAFLGNVVMDALKTHPICVVGSMIHQNTYYEDPAVFLEELHQRGSAAA